MRSGSWWNKPRRLSQPKPNERTERQIEKGPDLGDEIRPFLLSGLWKPLASRRRFEASHSITSIAIRMSTSVTGQFWLARKEFGWTRARGSCSGMDSVQPDYHWCQRQQRGLHGTCRALANEAAHRQHERRKQRQQMGPRDVHFPDVLIEVARLNSQVPYTVQRKTNTNWIPLSELSNSFGSLNYCAL